MLGARQYWSCSIVRGIEIHGIVPEETHLVIEEIEITEHVGYIVLNLYI
jgi:hypothetical protein